MSGCPQEAKKEMNAWVKYSYGKFFYVAMPSLVQVARQYFPR